MLLRHEGSSVVGVGSDHTDREVETYGVAVSKQLCDKPIAPQFWRYEDVAEHWDQLILRSWIDDERSLPGGHAERPDAPPRSSLPQAEPPLDDGTLMFCGTFGAIGGVRPAGEFRYELADPVLGRAIGGRYEMRSLPLVS